MRARGYRLMLLPFVAGSIILLIGPALLALGLAFTDFDGLSTPHWVGVDNFAHLLQEPVFQTVLRNSVEFLLLSLPIRLLGAYLPALWLSHPRRGAGLYRALVYLPSVLPDVAYALTWVWIVNPMYGPLNLALKAMGLAQPGWLADPNAARLVFVMMAALQIGEGFVIALSGLRGIPAERIQAAMVDGAGRWALFRHITLPLSLPWLALIVVRDAIFLLPWTFPMTAIMTGGDPYYNTLFIPLYARITSIDYLRFGQGSAAIVFMIVLAALVLFAFWRFARRGWYADEA
ncbi:MAG: sugar ABC transporter permease [Thermoflexales bacterium]|nr:sugar ABC transporter permease [Thermoflexales bacterium]